MNKLEPPKFLSDFYRDLRDRRLLIPVAGLLVAIVAVPMLLKSNSSEPAPPPAAAAMPDDATPVAPAVLVTDAGVRDYKKRLAELKKTNPFKQKYALPTPKSVSLQQPPSSGTDAGAAAASAATSSTGGPSSIDPTVTDTSTSTSASTSGSVTTETTTVTEDQATSSSSTPDPSKPPKPEVRFYAGRIDATVGPLGDAKRLDDVRYLDLLPNDKAPVVAFLGLAHGAQGAVFSVSRDVVETDGDGSCAPKKPSPCEFLTLGVGDQETLKATDGTTYRLRLLHTHVVRVPDPRTQNGDDQPDSTDG